MPRPVPTAPTVVPPIRKMRATIADDAPIDFRMAISRTFDSTIIVSDAMMLNAATTTMITRRSAMNTFCMRERHEQVVVQLLPVDEAVRAAQPALHVLARASSAIIGSAKRSSTPDTSRRTFASRCASAMLT